MTNDDGKLTAESKNRILEAFGFGSYENAKDISSLHIAKAGEENLDMKEADMQVDEYDDHDLHVSEHIRFLLSAEFKRSRNKEEIKKRFMAHIKAHKKALKNQQEM